MIGITKYANAVHIGPNSKLGLTVYPRVRARRFSFEHYHSKNDGWFQFGIASPTKHRRFAFSATLTYRNR